MSDQGLRERERRFRETGALEDEAAWLRARLQLGELSERRLVLAAFLGHAAARVALGEAPQDLSEDLDEWVDALLEAGLEAMVRASLAAAHLALAVEGPDPREVTSTGAEALALIEGWVLCPCGAHLEDVVKASALMAGRSAARGIVRLTATLIGLADRHDDCLFAALDGALELVGPARFKSVVGDEVRTWAVGHDDALRARVELRTAASKST